MEGLERYKKIKDLGEGAQGNVILAWDTLLERNVAIKSLHMSLTSDTLHVKRFKEEAKMLASLGHPSIVGVYEYIANSSGCHLMMEYFEGHPLDLYIRNVTGPIPEERAIDIYIKVLEAMSHIHKKKIIHRDIKPSNIMINDKSEIRLLDFGIAKNTENDPTLTKIGGSAGYTPMYMSPEHCNGEPITKYSDIYSLGITLWQMLTGKAPYEGFTQGQIYSKVANEPLPSIQSVYPKVSLKMNAIVQKATQKDPKKRFTTCDALKKELEQLKKHIKDIHTDFIFNLSVNIANGIDATIYLDEEQHYGTEFSKSFDVSKNSPITIKIEKPGYKKIKQQLFLKKNEVMSFNIEKQTDSFASLLLKLKNNTATYLKNISPNLSKLLIYLKLTSLWAFESVQLKFKKNNSEALELNTIETKKAIAGTVNTIKPHKKEYASYLVLLSLIFVAIFSFSTEKEALITDGTPEETPVFIPTVNFETLKTGIPDNQVIEDEFEIIEAQETERNDEIKRNLKKQKEREKRIAEQKSIDDAKKKEKELADAKRRAEKLANAKRRAKELADAKKQQQLLEKKQSVKSYKIWFSSDKKSKVYLRRLKNMIKKIKKDYNIELDKIHILQPPGITNYEDAITAYFLQNINDLNKFKEIANEYNMAKLYVEDSSALILYYSGK